MSKICKYCSEYRSLIEFRTERSTQCVTCKKKYRKNYALVPKNKARRKNVILKHKYGISEDDQLRLYKLQDGKCAICGDESRFHTDHDHNTGKVRGLLCNHCNRGLGGFKDNIGSLLKAIDYLKLHKEA